MCPRAAGKLVLRELAHALLVPYRSSSDADEVAQPDDNSPQGADFVLTQDDIITADMTVGPTQRLFVRAKPGEVVVLQGNGFSLRFDNTESFCYEYAAVLCSKFLHGLSYESFH